MVISVALVEDIIGFMDSGNALSIVIRAAVIYAFIIFAVRVTGKRGVGQATALDFIIALAIGDVVGEMAYGGQNLLIGFGIILVWVLIHGLVAYLEIKVPTIESIVSGKKTMVIKDGKILSDRLYKEQVTKGELMELLRELSIDEGDLPQIKRAYLETSGGISVFPADLGR